MQPVFIFERQAPRRVGGSSNVTVLKHIKRLINSGQTSLYSPCIAYHFELSRSMSEDEYARDRALIAEFLETFKIDDDDDEPYYLSLMQQVIDCESQSINVELQHIQQFSASVEEREQLLDRVMMNCKRYTGIFSAEVDKIMQDMSVVSAADAEESLHIIWQHQFDETGTRMHAPATLRRKYDVFFKPLRDQVPSKMREIGAKMIGHYVTLKGMCTRMTDVKPRLEVACYTCEGCGQEYFQEVTNDEFIPMQNCESRTCNKKCALFIETRASKFSRYQEAKIQELSEDVPTGHVPRSMSISLVGDMTRTLGPGDVVDISGIFLPRTQTGYTGTSSLVSTTYLQTMSIAPHKAKYTEMEETPEIAQQLHKLKNIPDIYTHLAKSIAPEIYGHVDVKKALLLLLCGGVTRTLADGVKIRGDVHVCLMGDPGVAKSQLLKHIVSIAPRGVYTTGRGSSGVGLTASIQRDNITQELILEGGALVLADRGICCIDEFDKMEESDRTAIHEVMEQQTVSIAKAGITTTLNARTTVLAAANPAFGRYNTSVSPQENINLPAALLSRFDLMWLILDIPDVDSDIELARHVMNVHREGRPPSTSFDPVSPSELRAYITVAKHTDPHVPEDLAEDIASAYSGIRQAEDEAGSDATGYTTARTLLSIIRLSEALARLRWASVVSEKDVEQALSLMKMSKASLEIHQASRTRIDPVESLYLVLRNWAGEHSNHFVHFSTINQLSMKHGLQDVVDACLNEYAGLGVWILDPQRSVTFVD